MLLNSLNSTRRNSSCKISYYGCDKGLIQECSYQTPDESCELVCRLLDLHKIEHEKNSVS